MASIYFWSAWLVVGIVLVIVFLRKVPALFAGYIVSSACGASDFGILTANLQDGSSVLCEPSALSSRYMARYQIYQRSSGRKFFIGEWKLPAETAKYNLFCYDSGGNVIDILRVSEKVGRKRFTAVTELPQSTDYIVFRLNKVNGERIHNRPSCALVYLWLALFLISCAAGVLAALCLIYAYLTQILPDIFSSDWSNIRLSAIIVCSITAAVYIASAAWLLFGGVKKSPAGAKKPRKRVKRSKAKTKNSGGVTGFIPSVWCNIRNVLQLARWSFPLKTFTLRKREAVPNARALKKLKKNEGKK